MTSLPIARRRLAVRLAGYRIETKAMAVVLLAALVAVVIGFLAPTDAARSVSIEIGKAHV